MLTNNIRIRRINSMVSITNLQMIPRKRTDKTFRIVLQQFDPTGGPNGRYRDCASVRLEAGSKETLESIKIRWKASISALFGEGLD